jgi:integrase
MAKPKFKLRPGYDPSKILMMFGYKKSRVVVSTGVSIERRFWDDKSQRARRTKDYPHAAKVNAMLERMSAEMIDAYFSFKSQGITPAPQALKEKFLAKWEKRDDKRSTMFKYIKDFIDERTAQNANPASLGCYTALAAHIEAYQAKRRTTLSFEDITEQFKDDFLKYLRSTPKKDGELLADGYVQRLLNSLRAVTKDAYRRGYISEDPTAKVKLTIRARTADTFYLTNAELKALFNLDGLEESLSDARDLFLIACFTGLRYSDYKRVRPENIRTIKHGETEQDCLVITSQKTKTQTVLPIANPMLKTILERHGNSAPPIISSQQFNKAIKELCKLAGFTQQIERREHRAGEELVSVVEKWTKISAHTARRTFATNAYKAGMSPASIMQFTGHKTEAAFLKYIKVSKEETAVTLAGHHFFTGASPLRKAE